jgi:ribosomal protein S6E (S10)
MVYKYESVYNIVEKLYRDYDHQEELDIWDIIEWAAEALEFIGAGQQYEKRVAELTIKNSMSALPCNFHSQPIASYQGKPINYATGSFAPLSTQTPTSSTNTINGFTVSDQNFPATENSSAQMNDKTIPNTFYVRDGVFVTNIAEGTVVLEYRGTKTDKDGFPMIPDLQSYRTAVTTYCQMMMDRQDYRKKRITKDVYVETKADWQWYCGQARGVANMPNLAYTEAIKDQWVKLRPNINSFQTFYSDQTLREQRKLK